MCAAMGCRRGPVLALRWSDIAGGIAIVPRSLYTDARLGLEFKSVKDEKPHARWSGIEEHRRLQDALREQFGPTTPPTST